MTRPDEPDWRDSFPRIHVIPELPVPTAEPLPAPPRTVWGWMTRAVVFVVALWLFVIALAVMKGGAGQLAPNLDGNVLTDSAASALGFGWLAAMLVMSGSPVAASAMVFLGTEAVSTVEGLLMLTGSRIGAATVVLAVAIVYALRRRGKPEGRTTSLSIGSFAVILTVLVYVPALLISLPILDSGRLSGVDMTPPHAFGDLIDTITSPVVGPIEAAVSGGWLFLAGLVLLLASLRIIDRALPAAESANLTERRTDWRNNRWLMLGLGSLVALVTMSVSVALTVVVPLVAKGHLRRRQAIPYILGANVTTLGDTLLVALVVGEPEGIEVILAELIGITIVTAILLMPGIYPRFAQRLCAATDWMLRQRRRSIVGLACLVGLPVVLIFGF